MSRKSDETKKKLKFGTGRGADYKPYIETREFNSRGTTANTIDWTTGRTVELMSQTEKHVWYLLRWHPKVIDVREQFPLDTDITVKIAEAHGILHPYFKGEPRVMTTDFLVTFDDGSEIAIYVKPAHDDWRKSRREIEKTFMQKYYWQEYMQTEFKIITNDDINIVLAENIEIVTQYYNEDSVFDDISLLKHLIARRKLDVEMSNTIINFRELRKGTGG